MHLLSVVNDLLDVASIESGALSLNEDEIEIGDVIRSCERMLRPRAQKAELLISVVVPAQGLVIRGDARRLKQILINLVNNAIKFTKVGGHVIVRAYCNEQGQPVLEVEDTGIGISEQDQKVIFEAFVRVNSAFVAQREGTGLGLPLVHALTTLHGGEIHLESEFGVGTKIAVILPKERLVVSSA
jgi:signal transduction histidine kinase